MKIISICKGHSQVGAVNVRIPEKTYHKTERVLKNWCKSLSEEEITRLLQRYNINGYKLD